MQSLFSQRPNRELLSEKTAAFILFAIWVCCLLIFIRFIEPPRMSDQMRYFMDAADPENIGVGVRDFRIGLIFPLHLFMKVFGYSELSFYFLPFLAFAGTASVIYLLGRFYFNDLTGLFAAYLFCTTPAVLREVSELLPDYFSAMLIGFAVLLMATATRADSENDISEAKLLALFACSGLLLGWAYLAREFATLIYPILGIAMVLLKVRVKHIFALSAGALLMLGVELLWNLYHYDDPLTRIRYVVFTRRELLTSPYFSSLAYETNFWPAFLQFFNIGSERSLMNGWLFMLGLGSLAVLALSAPRRYAYLVVWGLTSWALLTTIAIIPTFGGEMILRLHKFRYWAIVLPPLYIAVAATLCLGPSKLVQAFAKRSRTIQQASIKVES
ncbi:MAG: glycosyltransferase family 39 protein [Litorimonas sp.]